MHGHSRSVEASSVRKTGTDQPFLLGEFQPTPEYASVRELFADELRLLDAGQVDEWEVAYERISSRTLVLRAVETGETINDPLVHINDREAWFRH